MASNIQLFETALAHHTAGRLQEAEALYRQILEGDPNHGEAWHLLGVITLQAGNREQAMKLIGQAIAIDPQRGAFHHNLGMALELSDRSEEAIACYRKALSLEPTAASWHGLGRILRKRGEIEEAIQCYRNFLQLEPNSIDALFELGLLFQGVGLADEAFSAYHRCTQLKPDHTAAFNNMASLMRSGGKIREALALYQQAVNIEPDYAVAHANLGILYKDFYELEAAIQHLEKAVQLNPSMVEGHSNLGDTYAIIGDLDRAQTCYEQALALAPHDGLRLKLATRLPAIYPSTEEIEQWRSRFTQGIEALKGQPLSITDPTLEVGSTSFFLAYQGQDDRPVQQSLGKLYRSLNIWTHRTHRPNDKPRIGFISRFLSREHTIGRLYMGIADHLDRERFDVVVFTIAAQEKPNIHGSHTWVNLPDTGLPRIREEIARHNLDLLLYTDLGMDPATYFTAFNRLAPVQCTTWGHPVTSGIDTVDYFISSRLYEDESNQGHYTERLVLMDSTNTYYYRPTLMENPPGREDFGFAPTDHLYLCPQTLFKFHPDFDPILADILRQDPQGILVLVSGPVAQWGQALLDRFNQTMPDVTHRVKVLDKLPSSSFLALLAAGDVMLDTLHFGGGNTSLEAFAVNTPVVTLPGALLRGRLTSGLYQRMGITDCIVSTPEAYVQQALRLGTDPDYRAHMASRIAQASPVLYEDRSVVADYEAFFLHALEQVPATMAAH